MTKHENTGPYAGERCAYREGPIFDEQRNAAFVLCGEPATHKLGEEDPSHGQPAPDVGLRQPFVGHNLTTYVCCEHFTRVVGLASRCFS